MLYLRDKLKKYMQELYTENLETLVREIKVLNKYINISCSWIITPILLRY